MRKNIGNSELFESTSITVTTNPSRWEFYPDDNLTELGIFPKRKVDLGYYIDSNITGRFRNFPYADMKKLEARVCSFKQEITQGDIIKECQRLGVYKKYKLGAALILIGKMLKIGVIKKGGFGLIIYIEEEWDTKPCMISVWQEKSGLVQILCRKVDLADIRDAGDGLLF